MPANKQADIVNEAKDLAVEFAKALPFEERAYKACATVLQAQGLFTDEEEYLQKLVRGSQDADYKGLPLNKMGIPLPMCAMRYAEILLERGDYNEASEVADLGIGWTAQAQPSCRIGYFLYIEALCADALMFEAAKQNDRQLREEVVRVAKLYELAISLNAGTSYEETSRIRQSIVLAKIGEYGSFSCDEGDGVLVGRRRKAGAGPSPTEKGLDGLREILESIRASAPEE